MGISIRFIILAAIAAGALYWHWSATSSAYDAGYRAAQLEAAEARLKEISAREADLKSAQMQIDVLSKELTTARSETDILDARLEKALQDDKALRDRCPAAVPRSVRDILDSVR